MVGKRIELIPLRPDAEELEYRRISTQPRFERYWYEMMKAAQANDQFAAGFYIDRLLSALEQFPALDRLDWVDDGYNLACILSIGSGKFADKKKEYADRAIEYLQAAVQMGYKDFAHINEDKDLDPLRNRDDFKKLIADMEKKQAAPAAKKP